MRIGTCPVLVKRDFVKPARVSVCIVVCIPHQRNYYADRLAVLRLCLSSLRANTRREDYNLLVLDNGSCREVVAHLQALVASGDIDQLILSARNIGKINACRMLFDAAPGELVAYADDDVWFGAGWLAAQLAIIDTFPRVGMVSGRPVRLQFRYGNSRLNDYLAEFPDIRVRVGHFIPEPWEREFLLSLGRLDEDAVARVATDVRDVMLEHKGLAAYATATHFQFIAPRAIILAAMANRDQPRTGSEERQFEEAVEAMGFARLSTSDRYVRHIGNAITDDLQQEARAAGIDPDNLPSWRPASPRWLKWTRWPPVRAVLSSLNRWSYFLLNHP